MAKKKKADKALKAKAREEEQKLPKAKDKNKGAVKEKGGKKKAKDKDAAKRKDREKEQRTAAEQDGASVTDVSSDAVSPANDAPASEKPDAVEKAPVAESAVEAVSVVEQKKAADLQPAKTQAAARETPARPRPTARRGGSAGVAPTAALASKILCILRCESSEGEPMSLTDIAAAFSNPRYSRSADGRLPDESECAAPHRNTIRRNLLGLEALVNPLTGRQLAVPVRKGASGTHHQWYCPGEITDAEFRAVSRAVLTDPRLNDAEKQRLVEKLWLLSDKGTDLDDTDAR